MNHPEHAAVLSRSAFSVIWAFSAFAAFGLPLCAHANPVQDSYCAVAKQENASFTDFSATRGEAFYKAKTGDLWCSTCHGDAPKAYGRHATTGKDILPSTAVAPLSCSGPTLRHS